MSLVPLTPDLIEFRLAENPDIERGWFVPHMCSLIASHPEGCFAWIEDGLPVGVFTTTPYGAVGWFGWLYVKESCRHHGLGARLTQTAIDHLRDWGCRTVVLEAMEKAAPLYRRLGFKDQFTTAHWYIGAHDHALFRSDAVDVAAFNVGDLDQVAAFDRKYFHSDRKGIFTVVCRNPNFTGYIARIDGQIAGFLFGTRSTETVQVGPFIVDVDHERGLEIASSLAAMTLEEHNRKLNIKCPEVDPGRADLLRQLGATRGDNYTVRMYLGEPYCVESPCVLSLGCLGKG